MVIQKKSHLGFISFLGEFHKSQYRKALHPTAKSTMNQKSSIWKFKIIFHMKIAEREKNSKQLNEICNKWKNLCGKFSTHIWKKWKWKFFRFIIGKFIKNLIKFFGKFRINFVFKKGYFSSFSVGFHCTSCACQFHSFSVFLLGFSILGDWRLLRGKSLIWVDFYFMIEFKFLMWKLGSWIFWELFGIWNPDKENMVKGIVLGWTWMFNV
jgi:hypothetical protein